MPTIIVPLGGYRGVGFFVLITGIEQVQIAKKSFTLR